MCNIPTTESELVNARLTALNQNMSYVSQAGNVVVQEVQQLRFRQDSLDYNVQLQLTELNTQINNVTEEANDFDVDNRKMMEDLENNFNLQLLFIRRQHKKELDQVKEELLQVRNELVHIIKDERAQNYQIKNHQDAEITKLKAELQEHKSTVMLQSTCLMYMKDRLATQEETTKLYEEKNIELQRQFHLQEEKVLTIQETQKTHSTLLSEVFFPVSGSAENEGTAVPSPEVSPVVNRYARDIYSPPMEPVRSASSFTHSRESTPLGNQFDPIPFSPEPLIHDWESTRVTARPMAQHNIWCDNLNDDGKYQFSYPTYVSQPRDINRQCYASCYPSSDDYSDYSETNSDGEDSW